MNYELEIKYVSIINLIKKVISCNAASLFQFKLKKKIITFVDLCNSIASLEPSLLNSNFTAALKRKIQANCERKC